MARRSGDHWPGRMDGEDACGAVGITHRIHPQSAVLLPRFTAFALAVYLVSTVSDPCPAEQFADFRPVIDGQDKASLDGPEHVGHFCEILPAELPLPVVGLVPEVGRIEVEQL